MKSRSNTYHCSDEAYFRMAENSMSRAVQEQRFTESDRKLVENFTLRLKAIVSPARYFKVVSILVNMKRYFRVEYAAVDEVEYLNALSNMKYAKRQTEPHKGEPYTPNVITDWMKVTKRFFKYLHKHNLTAVPIDVIEGTKPGSYDRHCKTDDDVLTAEEISSIVNAASSIRYKAYIGLLYELGARSIELANMKWKDIEVKRNHISCTIHDSKTRRIRVVPAVTYAKYLFQWREQYPGDPTGENYVFINLNREPFKYASVRRALQIFVEKAGIQKRVTLHIFRHSRITHVLREGMNETLVKKAFWGNVSTGMIETYGHLTSSDVEKEYLRMAGIEEEQIKVDESPKPVTCPECLTVNPPGTRFCSCGKCLDPEVEKEMIKGIESLEEWFAGKSDIEKLNILKKFH